ncbi:MAG: SMI1/KNR4 family protein [Alphaproteobacteria bacterium]|nr:SMI1/KNR4 family protein [Alphaproteobacteria bacterium]
MEFYKKNEPLLIDNLKYFDEDNITIPESYKNFLIQYNGGRPENDHIDFKEGDNGTVISYIFGFTKERYGSFVRYQGTYAGRIPHNTIAIADDCLGNLIIMSVSGDDYGKIYFWDHEMEAYEGEEPDYSNLTLVADSFEEFINNLKSSDEIDE